MGVENTSKENLILVQMDMAKVSAESRRGGDDYPAEGRTIIANQ
jgi:hypothetical protein